MLFWKKVCPILNYVNGHGSSWPNPELLFWCKQCINVNFMYCTFAPFMCSHEICMASNCCPRLVTNLTFMLCLCYQFWCSNVIIIVSQIQFWILYMYWLGLRRLERINKYYNHVVHRNIIITSGLIANFDQTKCNCRLI